MRLWNSLQFRLYALFILLSLLLAVATYTNIQAVDRLSAQQRALNYAAQQRANAYLLSTLSYRLSDIETDEEGAGQQSAAELASLEAAIEQAIIRFDEIQEILRYGDPALGVEPSEHTQINVLLDQVDARWVRMKANLETFLALSTDTQKDAPILEDIDNDSGVVFTYADRMTAAYDAIVEEDERNIDRIFLGIGIIAALLLVFLIYVITQTARSINGLTRTAASFAAGNFSVRANTHTLQEISQVGSVFNNMAEQIPTLITSLEQRVSEAETARHQAERSDQVKSAFLASMSHELRTPLNSVINFSKFVANGVLGPINEQQKETLDEVIDSATHLLALINDVLDMSKIESGSLSLFVEEDIDIKKILENVVSTTSSLLLDKPIVFITEIDENLPLMRGDRQRLYQIVLNLVSNACKFTTQGHVKLLAKTENDSVQITVQDTGPGIASEEHDAVFEAFKQTTTGVRHGGGTGLGMPISKSLAEAHGGKLWLESEKGAGATFHVRLPVKSETLTPILFPAKAGVK